MMFILIANYLKKAVPTSEIKAEHPGLLELPEDKGFEEVSLSHYINLAKSKGRAAIMRGLLNLERWNKNKKPSISAKARKIINQLKKNEEWIALEKKS